MIRRIIVADTEAEIDALPSDEVAKADLIALTGDVERAIKIRPEFADPALDMRAMLACQAVALIPDDEVES